MKNHYLSFFVAITLVFGIIPLAKVSFAESNVSTYKTGSLKICRVIADNKDTISLASPSLPEGNFILNLSYRDSTSSELIVLSPLIFNSSEFKPNEKVSQSDEKEDMECVTYNNIPFGFYYYETEKISGEKWSETQYNDQYKTLVNSTVNFYDFDRKNNVDADGVMNIGVSRTSRTLMLLNRYSVSINPETKSVSSISFGGRSGSTHHEIIPNPKINQSTTQEQESPNIEKHINSSHNAILAKIDSKNDNSQLSLLEKYQEPVQTSKLETSKKSKSNLLSFAYGALGFLSDKSWIWLCSSIFLIIILFTRKIFQAKNPTTQI